MIAFNDDIYEQLEAHKVDAENICPDDVEKYEDYLSKSGYNAGIETCVNFMMSLQEAYAIAAEEHKRPEKDKSIMLKILNSKNILISKLEEIVANQEEIITYYEELTKVQELLIEAYKERDAEGGEENG